jgi:SAM-dependent methyltransferase
MEAAEYTKMQALEANYWWHQGRRKMILALIANALKTMPTGTGPRKIGDVGCGTGLLLEDLALLGQPTGLDYSPIALQISRQRGLQSLVRADAAAMPCAGSQFDLLTALDVVEHIADDHRVLSEFSRVLRPGGRLIISVPAHPSLWSSHDLALHHYRRYTKRALREVIEQSGLHLDRLTYGMFSPLLPALAWRLLLRPFRPSVPGPPAPGELAHTRAAGFQTDEAHLPPLLNGALKSILQAEAALLSRINLPAGLSLLCVASKPH